jgi:RNA polymerase sigma-70 factor (ECF subfamily)
MPTDAWYREIHERLLADDVTAPAELAEAVLEEPVLQLLTQRLRRDFPKLNDPDLLYDSVISALMNYIKRPLQFDPTKRSFIGFLAMAARGDLINALRQRRHWRKEISLEDVEILSEVGNNLVGGEICHDRFDSQKMWEEVHKLFPEPRDLEILKLIMAGEKKTEAFAKILGIENRSPEEQRLEVKRHKDRIQKRLERYGKVITKSE